MKAAFAPGAALVACHGAARASNLDLRAPMNQRRLLYVSLAILAVLATASAVVLAYTEAGRDKQEFAINLGGLRRALSDYPRGTLTANEREGILATREGSKLSRDVYRYLAGLWSLPEFTSNAFNGQIHTDTLLLLIERYGLQDPAAAKSEGQFSTDRWQGLYTEFTKAGSESELSALQAGLRLEELGVQHLQTMLAQTGKDDLRLVYAAILRGAALNLRDLAVAFRRMTGETYDPQHINASELREILRTPPGEIGAGSLLMRGGGGPQCTFNDLERRPRRRTGRVSSPEAIRREACSLEITFAGSPTRMVNLESRRFQLRLFEASRAQFPAPVDSNSPAVWQQGTLNIFNSWIMDSFKASGGDVQNLAGPVTVQRPRPERPGAVWLEAIWRDPNSSTLYGWYHFEPADLPCPDLTAPIIGAAISRDGGLTWQDQGFVLTSAYEPDCEYDNGYFAGGHGDFSVVVGPEGRYFYFVFSSYAGPTAEQGVAVARSPFAARGQPGTAVKYHNGGWNEPGIGGKVTPLLASSTGWKGPHIESFWGPSVHWNATIRSYVALLNHTDGEQWVQDGVYVTFSSDLVNWTAPQKILETNHWYPQVIGLGEDGTDSLADRFMRIYVGGVSAIILEFLPQG